MLPASMNFYLKKTDFKYSILSVHEKHKRTAMFIAGQPGMLISIRFSYAVLSGLQYHK